MAPQAAMERSSQPTLSLPQTPVFPRPCGGSLRSVAQSAGFAALFASGLYLWLWPGDSLVLWMHLLGGVLLAMVLSPWLWRHIPHGLAHSQRRVFTLLSWGFLASYLAVLVTGLAMAVPAAIWLLGRIWFPARGVTALLSFLHFWAGWLAAAGVLLHLIMRHWVVVRK